MSSNISSTKHAYKCNTCNRSVKVTINATGIEIMQRCIITANCLGKMMRLTTQYDVTNTPSIPPEVAGLTDWSVRSVLNTHAQTVRAAVWNVQHNLENNPTVFVYVNRVVNGIVTLTEFTPKSINIIDMNNTQIVFNQAESGLVQCVALSSQRALTPSTSAVNTNALTDIQLTHIGEMTFATLDPTASISFTVMFNSPAAPQPIVIQYLNVSTVPSATSPWVGVNYTSINGKKYYVRSVNILSSLPAPIMFQSGMIATGATVYFPNSMVAGQVLILLANNPMAAVDRIYDKYCDTASVGVSSPQMYYSVGEVYANQSIIKNTYPPIIAM